MFVLALIAVSVVEVVAFVEVAGAIGWPVAVVLLLGSSIVGVRLLRIEGRAAIARVSLAVSQRRPAGTAAVDGALGFIGAALLAVPGFVTAALGVLLLLRPTRALVRDRMSRRFARRAMSFAARTNRFAPGARERPLADVESTAVEHDANELGR
jgi:UPF0716 protein FxsA